ncbi:MAG: alkaline phosphatase D family protein [Gordonia sp. (in: high G+C Gram-positive bacteria)]
MNSAAPSFSVPALGRRTFLGAAGASALALGASSLVRTDARGDGPASAREVFAHGVASGDPLPDRVILWTRVTPARDATPGSGRGASTTVRWEVATDRWFSSVVASGSVVADVSGDHTVKVDAAGLHPATHYWFRFGVTDGPAAGATSPIGRTKTAPANDADPSAVRFGVVSCSNWEAGFFSSYRELAKREVDAVVHLGDYLYEYGTGEYGGKSGPVRIHQPSHDIVSLADYRIRHAQYKTDPDLQAAHARHPFICTWDDHESADNAWSGGAENHDPKTQGAWAPRKAASERAYFEWMPVRPQAGPQGRHLYRRFRYGNLLELSMLDLRTYRDLQPSRFSGKKVDDPSSSITGKAQMEWLTGGIETSPAKWQIVGNPVMISPILIPPLDPERTRILSELTGVPAQGVSFNPDAWDGYPADRKRLLDAIDRSGKHNTVFITGDIHMSWACEIPRNAGNYPGAGTVATEFVVTSISSNNLDDMVKTPEGLAGPPAAAAITATNRNTKWVDTDAHGYAVLTVNSAAAQMDWYFAADRARKHSPHRHAQSWKVKSGSRRLTRGA